MKHWPTLPSGNPRSPRAATIKADFVGCALLAIAAQVLLCSGAAYASSGEVAHQSIGHSLIWVALLLAAGKVGGLVERWGPPAVLGEILAGVVVGNLALAGLTVFEPAEHDPLVLNLAELGAVILLFQVGLESNIRSILNVGVRAFLVACVGVALPLTLITYLFGPWLMPGHDFHTYLFLGATMTATSVGITARIFRDLGKLGTREARIVLGAAVIDDVLGLVILAVVSALVSSGTIEVSSVALITAKAFVFLAAAVFVGRVLAPVLGRALSVASAGHDMKLVMALVSAFVVAFLADAVGLAPIVGAFAAGLVLDPVHFSGFREPETVEELREFVEEVAPGSKGKFEEFLQKHSARHVEELVRPIADFMVPLFFVSTGMVVHLEVFSDPKTVLIALGITAVAIVAKIGSGLVAGRVNKLVVGVGMIPRGEVGLIFAATGKALGVVTDELYAIIVIAVVLSTLLPPPFLAALLRRMKTEE